MHSVCSQIVRNYGQSNRSDRNLPNHELEATSGKSKYWNDDRAKDKIHTSLRSISERDALTDHEEDRPNSYGCD